MPALNEEETIEKVISSIPKTISGVEKIEVLVVDDGSTDQTRTIALASGAHVVSHNKNKGVGLAFQTAVDFALTSKADVLVSIDADGQFDVHEISSMIQPILMGYADFCIGVRFKEGKPPVMPFIKYWGNKQVNRIVSFVSNTKINDASCGFRAYSRDCLLSLNLHGSFTYTHETILDLLDKGFKIAQVPVKVTYFEYRVSRIADSIVNYAAKTSMIIFKSLKDYKPLMFFLSIAFFIFIIGFLLGGWTLIHWIINKTITPYKGLGIIGLTFIGLSFIISIFAFMADMLGRIRRNQEKILFFLKKTHFDESY